jgi:hypothetical protein
MPSIEHPLHVVVRFGSEIPAEFHGAAMLQFERDLRARTGQRVEVFKDNKGDDSKLRMMMTAEQRAKL